MGLLFSSSKIADAEGIDSYTPDLDRRALIPRLGTRSLQLMADFADTHAVVMLCRTLSREDKQAVEGRLKFISLDHVVLRVPGELLESDLKNAFLVRTHLGEEIQFYQHDKLLEIARENAVKLSECVKNREQLNPYLQREWLRYRETMKAAEVLEVVYKKLNFYEDTLKVDVKELTILDPKSVLDCHAVGEQLAKLLAELPHLRRVNGRGLTSLWFQEQMKNECPQLVSQDQGKESGEHGTKSPVNGLDRQ